MIAPAGNSKSLALRSAPALGSTWALSFNPQSLDHHPMIAPAGNSKSLALRSAPALGATWALSFNPQSLDHLPAIAPAGNSKSLALRSAPALGSTWALSFNPQSLDHLPAIAPAGNSKSLALRSAPALGSTWALFQPAKFGSPLGDRAGRQLEKFGAGPSAGAGVNLGADLPALIIAGRFTSNVRPLAMWSRKGPNGSR